MTPRPLDDATAIAALAELLPYSPLHRGAPPEGVERCLHSAIRCGQYLLFFDDADRPLAFVSWAWLGPEAEAGYLDGTRLLRPGDFPRMNDSDVLWVVDLLAPFGQVRQVCRLVRQVLTALYPDAPRARIRRGARRLGHFAAVRASNPDREA